MTKRSEESKIKIAQDSKLVHGREKVYERLGWGGTGATPSVAGVAAAAATGTRRALGLAEMDTGGRCGG